VRFQVERSHEGVGDRHAGLILSECSTACTVRPAFVVVPRMAARNSSHVRNGVPAQFPLIKLNRRCSIGFHLDKVS
jgi:hypothetical protein